MKRILQIKHAALSILIGEACYVFVLLVLYRGQFIQAAPVWDLLLISGAAIAGITGPLGWHHGEALYVNRALLNASLHQKSMAEYALLQQAMPPSTTPVTRNPDIPRRSLDDDE